MSRIPLSRCLTLALAGAASAVLAQQPEQDPSTVAARLSYSQGAVSMQPAGSTDWVGATINRPFTTGDKLWSDQGARAELQLGPVSIRTDEATAIALLDLDANTLQWQLSAGTLALHVPVFDPSETIEVDTPILAVSVGQAGDYRIEVNESGDVSAIKVSGGSAQVHGGGDTFEVGALRQAVFTDTGGLTEDLAPLGAPDDFDGWCLQRDQQQQRSLQAAAPYVSPEMTGYEDLSAYGTWQSMPDYGEVWTPDAAPIGWAPYTFGSWVWIAPWGWTWIDREPWGFAPFHYGRWLYVSGTWCWVPGPIRGHPVYAPALVGWVNGARVGPSAGIGWFALGPRDVYVPGYAASATYIHNVNASNSRLLAAAAIAAAVRGDARLHSINQSISGAVVAMPQDMFVAGAPAGSRAARLMVSSSTLASATPPSLLPSRASALAGAVGGRSARAPPPALLSRRVVVRRLPPPPPPTFAQQLQLARANGGLPPTLQQFRQFPGAAPAASSALAPQAPRPAPGPNSAWDPGGSPTAARASRHDRPPGAQASGNELRTPTQRQAAPRTEGQTYSAPADTDRYVTAPPASPPPAPSVRPPHVHAERRASEPRPSGHSPAAHESPK